MEDAKQKNKAKKHKYMKQNLNQLRMFNSVLPSVLNTAKLNPNPHIEQQRLGGPQHPQLAYSPEEAHSSQQNPKREPAQDPE